MIKKNEEVKEDEEVEEVKEETTDAKDKPIKLEIPKKKKKDDKTCC